MSAMGAPFHTLASEGAVHTDKPHTWHMEMIAKLCVADTELCSQPHSGSSTFSMRQAPRVPFFEGWRCRLRDEKVWSSSGSTSSLEGDAELASQPWSRTYLSDGLCSDVAKESL